MVTIMDALKIDAMRAVKMLESLVDDINSKNISSMPDILSVTLKRNDLLISEKMFIAYALGASVAKIEMKKEKQKDMTDNRR